MASDVQTPADRPKHKKELTDPEERILDSISVVKVAGHVQEVEPGVTQFGSCRVLERLPATVSSLGVVKALWRLQCLICKKQMIRDLTNGKLPGCSCAIRAKGEARHVHQVLVVFVSEPSRVWTLRQIKKNIDDFGTEDGISNEITLKVILQELIAKKRIEPARDEQSRGYRLNTANCIMLQPEQRYNPPIDNLNYDDDNEEIQQEPDEALVSRVINENKPKATTKTFLRRIK